MRFEFQNRNGLKIVGIFEPADRLKGIAIVAHGLGGFKEQPHIVAIAEAFRVGGYSAIRYDATGSPGESEGDMILTTPTTFLHDLEDVLRWAKAQDWWMPYPILAGHSMGALAALMYVKDNGEDARGLALFSPIVSGKLLMKVDVERFAPQALEEWRRVGYRERINKSKPGTIIKEGWRLAKEIMTTNVLQYSEKITLPVLLVTGEYDAVTPPEHIRLLYEKLPGQKEFHIVKNAKHNFRAEENLKEIKEIIKEWIDKIPNL